MMKEDVQVRLLRDSLASELGLEFKVNANYLTGSLDPMQRSMADLVIWPPHNRRPIIVEYKGIRGDGVVPLHAVLQLLRVGDVNSELQPRLVLATTGKIRQLVRDEAASKQVSLVEASDLSELSRKLVGLVRELEVARP